MAKQKPAATAVATTLTAVKQEIAKKQLDWEAGQTSLSELTPTAVGDHFGLAMEPDLLAATAQKVTGDEQFWGVMGAFAPPPKIDWRSKDGGDYVKGARYQASCNSCVAFAVVGAIEANVRIACRNPSYNIALSETDLFACGCGACCSSGWYPQFALEYCQSHGVASAADVPYRPINVACPPNLFSRLRIAGSQQLTTRQSIKQAIFDKGPCVYGMAVFDDFRYYRSGVYRHASGGKIGLHAILIVGYDDDNNCWICKNSWGTSWGENGFFRIYYDDTSFFGPGYAFPAFSVTVACPGGGGGGPVVGPQQCEQFVPALKDVIHAGWSDSGFKSYLQYWVCGLGQPLPINAQYDPVTLQVRSIMRTCPHYLNWFCENLMKN